MIYVCVFFLPQSCYKQMTSLHIDIIISFLRSNLLKSCYSLLNISSQANAPLSLTSQKNCHWTNEKFRWTDLKGEGIQLNVEYKVSHLKNCFQSIFGKHNMQQSSKVYLRREIFLALLEKLVCCWKWKFSWMQNCSLFSPFLSLITCVYIYILTHLIITEIQIMVTFWYIEQRTDEIPSREKPDPEKKSVVSSTSLPKGWKVRRRTWLLPEKKETKWVCVWCFSVLLSSPSPGPSESSSVRRSTTSRRCPWSALSWLWLSWVLNGETLYTLPPPYLYHKDNFYSYYY